jgi:two-component system, NarL family, nitrate/nitrite response regulator NarL
VIADDHAIFRAALGRLLGVEPGFEVVGEASDGEAAVRLTCELRPDVVLIDHRIPAVDRAATLQMLSGVTRTIVFATRINTGQIVGVLRAGARGILMKDAPLEVLYKGIKAVAAGQHWVGRERVGDLVDYLKSGASGEGVRKFGLTSRELEVVRAVVAGFTNREIAARLSISPNTTKHHLSNVFDKLGVSNRLELALFAYHHAVADDESSVLELAV